MMKIVAFAVALTALGAPAAQARTCKSPPKQICRVEHHPKICKVEKKSCCHHVTHTSCYAPG